MKQTLQNLGFALLAFLLSLPLHAQSFKRDLAVPKENSTGDSLLPYPTIWRAPLLNLSKKGQPITASGPISVLAGQQVTADLSASYARSRLLRRLPLALIAAGVTSWTAGVAEGSAETSARRKKPQALPFLAAGAVLAPAVVKSLKGAPKAYARLLLYDKEGRLLSQTAQSVTREAGKKGQLLHLQLPAQQDGFARLELMNQSRQEVRFEQVHLLATPPLATPEQIDGGGITTYIYLPDDTFVPPPGDDDGGGSGGGGYVGPEVEIITDPYEPPYYEPFPPYTPDIPTYPPDYWDNPLPPQYGGGGGGGSTGGGGEAIRYYRDSDGDGWGAGTSKGVQLPGWVPVPGDHNDNCYDPSNSSTQCVAQDSSTIDNLISTSTLDKDEYEQLKIALEKMLGNCVGKAIYNALCSNSVKFDFGIDSNISTAQFSPRDMTVKFHDVSTIDRDGLQEELFHAYQNMSYPGGTAQYENTARANIEFEAKLLRDIMGYVYNFGSRPATYDPEYYIWIDNITNGGTNFPTSYSVMQDKYFYFMGKFLDDSPGYAGSAIDEDFAPAAIFSLIDSSTCQH